MDNFEYGTQPDGPPVLGYIMLSSVAMTTIVVGSIVFMLIG